GGASASPRLIDCIAMSQPRNWSMIWTGLELSFTKCAAIVAGRTVVVQLNFGDSSPLRDRL
ncbi:MAG: hypothetical protein ABSH28_22315, partial [Acidobacteriota bacterium]